MVETPEYLAKKKEVGDKLTADLQAGKRPPHVVGAFGDVDGCMGLIEEGPIFPPEGGIFMRLYGCPYLLTGFPEKGLVEYFGLPKAMVSAIPRELVLKDPLEVLKLLFDFVFRRRKVIHKARVYFNAIYANFIKKLPIDEVKYNKVCREIKRSVRAVVERSSPSDILHQDFDVSKRPNRETLELIMNVVEFLCYLLEMDSAYRFPFQDVVGELDKEKFKKSVPKAVKELLGVMEERWQVEGLKSKPRLISRLVVPILYLSPTLRRFIREVVAELNLSKIRMDENDWYFCLEREQYNYAGLEFYQRMICRKAMDEKALVVRLDIQARTDGGVDVKLL